MPEAAHHVAVARAGADHHAQPGAVDDRVQRRPRRRCTRPTRTRRYHGYAISSPSAKAAGEPRRRGDAVDVVADEQAAQLLEHQDQRVGHQHLLQVVALVEEAEERPLEQVAEHRREQHADDEHRVTNQSPNQRREREREVGAEHVEAAVRQVDHAHDPEDQRQPAGDEEQQQAVLDGVQALDEEGGEVHARLSGRAAAAEIKDKGGAVAR